MREMMNKYDVNIRVPAADAKSDIILVSGVPSNVEAAKEGFAERMQELEAEKEERLKRSFEVGAPAVNAPGFRIRIDFLRIRIRFQGFGN